MTTTINASTSAGLVQTADTSGVLALQTAGTTAVTIDTSQNVGIGGTATANGAGYVTLGVNGTTAGIIEWKANGVRQAQGYATTSQLALGTTTAIPFVFTTNNSEQMRITSAGNVTKPASSTFLAKVATNVANVTGDGTLYTIIYDQEILDYNANYNPSTGVFTAPVTGAYQFNVLAYLYALTAAVTTVEFTLVTSNRSYQFIVGNWFNGYAQFPAGSITADMDTADTAYVTVKVSGTTKTISIGQASSFFSGFLVG